MSQQLMLGTTLLLGDGAARHTFSNELYTLIGSNGED